jgi:predicted nucleotidyltransferase
MTGTEDLLNKVAERILSVAKPKRIILFGSAAMDSMTPDSDLDLLVIEPGLINQREENTRLREALGELDIPIDVFAMEPERFEETKEVIGGLAYPANKYGRVIYEAS